MNEGWQALLDQASALRRGGRVPEAIDAYQRLLAIRPDLAESWYNLGWLQRQARRFEEALESYRQALSRGVADPQEVHLNRAVILSDQMGRSAEAEAELQKALAIDPAYVPALLNLGNLAEDLGKREQARSAYLRALESDPESSLPLARLAGISEARTPDDPLIGQLRRALDRTNINPGDRADLGFALGRLLDGAGAYDEAFEVYRRANAASRASLGASFRGYDRTAHEEFFDRLIRTFSRPVVAQEQAKGQAPLFICGMFRSGSTLAEQLLACHSAIAPGGELDLIPSIVTQHLRPYPEAAGDLDGAQVERLRTIYLEGLARLDLGAALVTDKRPDNFLHIGLIKTLFPQAKIINTCRNPLDNCLSLYFLHLNPRMAYALDLDDAAHWHGQYRRLMRHWRSLYPDEIFDLDYDELVERPRPTVRALLDFCGLEWDEACLDFGRVASPVKTASVWQVRQPLYTRSSGRWRNYAHLIEPLRSALQRLDRSSPAGD